MQFADEDIDLFNLEGEFFSFEILCNVLAHFCILYIDNGDISCCVEFLNVLLNAISVLEYYPYQGILDSQLDKTIAKIIQSECKLIIFHKDDLEEHMKTHFPDSSLIFHEKIEPNNYLLSQIMRDPDLVYKV